MQAVGWVFFPGEKLISWAEGFAGLGEVEFFDEVGEEGGHEVIIVCIVCDLPVKRL